MRILDFFKFHNKCEHWKVRPDVDYAYCPDCGELVENQWYLVRCSCCGVKLKGVIKNNNIIPEKHFCHNCGARDFVVERIDKINFIDINYAVLMRVVVERKNINYIQSWIDCDFRTSNYRPKLLQQFL